MFTESAHIYDAIYASLHDFPAEADKLCTFITQHTQTLGNTLLDVACGTGAYLVPLSRHYVVEGLDLDPDMLEVAARKLPGVPLHRADMVDFNLGRRFDVVLCLGSSIGYARTAPRMRKAIQRLARHVLPGGVVVVEPWFGPNVWQIGRVHGLYVDQPNLKIARMSISGSDRNISILDFHYLVATSDGVTHSTEHHELGLFTHDEYLAAFRETGLDVAYDNAGLTGRGLYLGIAQP